MPAAAGSSLTEDAQKNTFGDMLKNHLAEVNHLQNSADIAAQNLASGQDKDIHNTMIAMEKAGVAFQLTMQVRNKVLEAYQEIMRMQV
ncbi:MAG: flagellar hook-basal body complex protein FliE [Deltaproteobacteria bacterium]|nr:flagellar hook-basal body complex protein FliE [Deltaproteobacteria bacterium]